MNGTIPHITIGQLYLYYTWASFPIILHYCTFFFQSILYFYWCVMMFVCSCKDRHVYVCVCVPVCVLMCTHV